MPPRPRPENLALPNYGTGRPGAPPHRLGSNESPFPPSDAVLAAVARAVASGNRYPPLRPVELEERLAERLGLPTAHVLTGGGSIAVLEQLLRAFAGPGDAVAYGWRSYEAYPIVARAAGATVVQIPLQAGRYDLGALAAAITPEVRVVLVCNPNNPTGTVLERGALARFVDAVPDDVLLVVDEAYREFVPAGATDDGVELARSHRHVAVLRTFSKAYGLAGLRAGYCIADPTVVDAARRVALPFTLSGPALAAALAALAEAQVAEAQVSQLVAARDPLVAALTARGLPVLASAANFLWLPLGTASGEFAACCAAHGVGVRPFPGEGVRVSLGDPAAHDALLAAAGLFSQGENSRLQNVRTAVGSLVEGGPR